MDSHVPAAVGPALARLRECEVVHLARWRGGAYLHRVDEEILRAASEEKLIFVTQDINTVPDSVAAVLASGAPLTGVAFAPSRVFGTDIGALARAPANLLDHPDRLDPDYPVVFLRPLPRGGNESSGSR